MKMRSAAVWRPGIIALGLALLLSRRARRGPMAAAADDDPIPTCPRGQVWDSRTQRCVEAQSGVLPDKALADYAYALAKAERYDEALAVLDLMQDREHAGGAQLPRLCDPQARPGRRGDRLLPEIGGARSADTRRSANISAKPM